MNGEKRDDDGILEDDLSEDDSSEDVSTETIVLSEVDDDAIGDTTIEMSIEKLVEKLEASDSEDVHRRAEIRRKLEELREQREKELDSTFNFNLDDDI
ncbi:MAG: hypothetical protein GY785_23615 [Gammaproteobacteria bacterium]|nr:hypothetical protein [Gammaproteobacteria bacterium]